MFNARLISFIGLFCFFKSIGESVKKPTVAEKLGKPVFVYLETSDFIKSEQFTYTTALSRILLVGEHPIFERIVRGVPFINNLTNPVISLAGPLFDNRFENFIKSAERFSQKQLQEAVQDAVLLSPYAYNTKSYSAKKLLNILAKSLQNKIDYMNYEIQHDSKWDQKSFGSVKKSGAWAVGLITLVAITNKYIDGNAIENQTSNLEFINAVATLGLLPVSYKILKNCYKMLTIRPNNCNEHLNKYAELLLFVQKLKSQLETNGFITFELNNGVIATLKDDHLFFS